jgi:ArsR family transcriptional regulator, arsenate/arsenite/antimonite-responsive transcriptional repressor / arsenate reductase (thioredoxin)
MDTALSSTQSPDILKLLAHDVRWKILSLLARSDYCVQELVRFLAQPQNLVSYHLRRLHDHGIVTERRSTADGRDIYYSLNMEKLQALYFTSAGALHPALGQAQTSPEEQIAAFPHKPVRILFLCTSNSARSQMAEGLLRHLNKGQIEAFSAGSNPGSLHPYAVRVMASMSIDISQQRAKHFDEFRGQSFDHVITVCDRVREICPTFPGNPEPDHIHWSLPDPSLIDGSAEEKYALFEQIARQLRTRIRYLLILLEHEALSVH